MEYDKDKVDDMTLALMWLVSSKDRYGVRAWKGFDWDTLNRLHEKGLISNPVGKAKSVALTDAAYDRARELFQREFGSAAEARESH
ncbi:MAG: DUF6429 family protein [Bacteroidia bacterium]|nr:DUF6429 family protein [Bacteroidia bacterium]